MARIFGYASPEELLSSVTDFVRQLYASPSHREEFGEAMCQWAESLGGTPQI